MGRLSHDDIMDILALSGDLAEKTYYDALSKGLVRSSIDGAFHKLSKSGETSSSHSLSQDKTTDGSAQYKDRIGVVQENTSEKVPSTSSQAQDTSQVIHPSEKKLKSANTVKRETHPSTTSNKKSVHLQDNDRLLESQENQRTSRAQSPYPLESDPDKQPWNRKASSRGFGAHYGGQRSQSEFESHCAGIHTARPTVRSARNKTSTEPIDLAMQNMQFHLNKISEQCQNFLCGCPQSKWTSKDRRHFETYHCVGPDCDMKAQERVWHRYISWESTEREYI